MNEPTYYTPEPEELRVGFECELNLDGNGFVPHALHKGDINGVFFYKTIHGNNIRVKRLDSPDIIEAGWKHIKGDYYNLVSDSSIELQYDYTVNYLYIQQYDEGLFQGTIRNKSELVILMKQLNIK